MKTKIQKWGNSQGIRFNKDIMESIHLHIGDSVEVKVDENRIIIEPDTSIRGKYDIKNLLKDTPSDFNGEADWGTPQGNEVW